MGTKAKAKKEASKFCQKLNMGKKEKDNDDNFNVILYERTE